MTKSETPPTHIDGMAALADRYDAFVVDQFGVLHAGAQAFHGVVDALRAIKERGKPLIILSNSGKRAAVNADRMVELGIPRDLYTDIVTSGEVTWSALCERKDPRFAALGQRCVLLAHGADTSVVDGSGVEIVNDVADADFILVGGLNPGGPSIDDLLETLTEGGTSLKPMICANPDLVGPTPSGLTVTPGTLARRYQAIGGEVITIGKPHREVYEACRGLLGNVPRDRVCAVGDSVEHDIAGGIAAGLATAFIMGGIHGDVFADGGDPVAAYGALHADYGCSPDWLVPLFRW